MTPPSLPFAHVEQAVGAALSAVLSTGQFALAPGRKLQVHGPQRATWRWEILHGQLLPAAFTRQEREFLCWTVALGDRDAGVCPLVSILDDGTRLWVVRHILTHGVETYTDAAEPHVIRTRPAQVWLRELVGSAPHAVATSGVAPSLHANQPASQLQDIAASLFPLLREMLQKAFWGASRLPVTSRESPLPAFSLGQCTFLGAWPALGADATGCHPLNLPALAVREATAAGSEDSAGAVAHRVRAARWLEFALRAADDADVPAIARQLLAEVDARGVAPEIAELLLLEIFHGAALTPHTGFARRWIALLAELAAAPRPGLERMLDLIAKMLHMLARHLTAYDLRTFHSYGADYPDLLLLDGLLRWYVTAGSQRPELFRNGGPRALRRRRALRQAWLLRRQYQDLPVPAAPTSQGENARVLPPEFPHLEDEEILAPARRARRLFQDDPWVLAPCREAAAILAAALLDLRQETELRELGTALYLDRPLGYSKPPGTVDATPLLSYVAFSRHIARQRLALWREWELLDSAAAAELQTAIKRLPCPGFPATQLPGQGRVGVVSLEDCWRAAPDFVFLRTTQRSLARLWQSWPLASVAEQDAELAGWLRAARGVLLIRTAPESPADGPYLLSAFDADMRRRAVFVLSGPGGEAPEFVELAGDEFPRHPPRLAARKQGAGRTL